MQATFPRLTVITGIVLSLFSQSQAQAHISVIITAAPPPRAIVVEPRGYSRCYTVPQGFYNNVWHYRHRVCEYPDPKGFRMWVSGYWQCVGFDLRGRCTRTYWLDGHWADLEDPDYQIGYEHYQQEPVIQYNFGHHYGPRHYGPRPYGPPAGVPGNVHSQGNVHGQENVHAQGQGNVHAQVEVGARR